VPDIVKSLAIYYPLPLSGLSVVVAPVLLEVAAVGLWLAISVRRAKDQRERQAQIIANPKG
jgi:ligand-binding sensor domain-containing protein